MTECGSERTNIWSRIESLAPSNEWGCIVECVRCEMSSTYTGSFLFSRLVYIKKWSHIFRRTVGEEDNLPLA